MRWLNSLLILGFAVHSPTASALGNLLMSPEQRQQQENDYRRRTANAGEAAILTGEVVRSRGKSTHWIDGDALRDKDSRAAASEALIRPRHGKADELLGGGRIIIQPSGKPP